MDDRFRLVFRGEVLEGQHAAVVKKKLGEALKVAGERLDSLFAGKPVVIRKDVDTAEAARYQAAFKKAGARLRVMPVEGADRSEAAQAAATGSALVLAPPGELLKPEERRKVVVSTPADTSHLSLAAVGAVLGIEAVPVPAVEPREWELAEPGERLSDEPAPMPSVDAPEWPLAAPGTRLTEAKPPAPPAVDADRIDLTLAAPGARLQPPRPKPPPAPDTSHLSLKD